MQNYGRFLYNLTLWSRISQEHLKISKIGKLKLNDREQFLKRSTKRSGELWSTNDKDLYVSMNPLKCTFLGDYISALRGCCPLKFLHALEIDQILLAHTPTETGVPQKINRENLKFGLKFTVWVPITSGLVGVSSGGDTLWQSSANALPVYCHALPFALPVF